LIRKIEESIPQERLRRDLESLRQRAIELGASDAKVIGTDQVLIDERVRMKCIYPKCAAYGTNAHCPPHAIDLDLARKVVSRYQYGILYTIQVPSQVYAGAAAAKEKLYIQPMRELNSVASELEAEAFYAGYYFALAFSSGPCKPVFCPGVECSALIPGQGCRARMRARGSMEGFGMDAYGMAVRAGWDIYPCGWRAKPEDIPHGRGVGLVLIH
jgi:predicted metal-binding protein